MFSKKSKTFLANLMSAKINGLIKVANISSLVLVTFYTVDSWSRGLVVKTSGLGYGGARFEYCQQPCSANVFFIEP